MKINIEIEGKWLALVLYLNFESSNFLLGVLSKLKSSGREEINSKLISSSYHSIPVKKLVFILNENEDSFLFAIEALEHVLYFSFNPEGLESLLCSLEGMQWHIQNSNEDHDHDHFRTPEWAGSELTNKPRILGSTLINMMTIWMCDNGERLTKGFEGAVLKEFKFLRDKYGFAEPRLKRGGICENIEYTKGSLGIGISYDALDGVCATYFFDASLEKTQDMLAPSEYHSRCAGLPQYNPQSLKLPEIREKSGALKPNSDSIGVKNEAICLKAFFEPVLKTDVFVCKK